MRVRLLYKLKPNSYTESCAVSMTGRWRERACEYPGRPHGHGEKIFLQAMVETRFVMRSQMNP